MADLLSIVGVIGVAVQILQMTVQFGLDLKDAPSDARTFVIELQALKTVLEETDRNVTHNKDFLNAFEGRHSTVLSQLGDQSQQTAAKIILSACKTELEKVLKDLKTRAHGHRLSWETLKGAFAAKKTRETMENLHRQCQVLNSIAAIDAIALSASTHCELIGIRKDQQNFNKALENVHGHQLSQEEKEERKSILEWLTPVDYAPQQNDFIKRRQSGTGQWLLDSPEFQEWLQADKQTLFCPGIPGAGKTILTAIVIDYLINRYYKDPNISIAYIYCNFRRKDEQKLDNLLASLLKQLSEKQPSIPNAVRGLYEQHNTKRTRPSVDEISRALQSIVATCPRVFLIIDALDECQNIPDGCRSRLVEEAFKLQARCGANLFMTSRFLPEITEKFHKTCSLEIRATREDIERYLEYHIKQSSYTIQEMQEEIKATISDAVDGMFLLARIYLDLLSGEVKPRKIRTALQGFRKQIVGSGENQRLEVLCHAYDQAMERINEQIPGHRELAKQVLSWIACAKRPLSTAELQHALSVELGDSTLRVDGLLQIDDMVAVCAGLVTIDEESNIIRLVHYTTQEYFQQTITQWFPDAEKDISTICVTYLSFSQFETGPCGTDDAFEQRQQGNPLYDYAARSWGHHARLALISTPEIIRFLSRPALIEASSQALFAAKRRSGQSNYSQKFPKQMTALHAGAYFGVVEVVTELLKLELNADSKDNAGQTPLSWAARNGHEAIVKLLLDKGAAIESKDTYNQTPLSYAAQNNHEAIVQLLLDKGAATESKDRYGQTPLSYAAQNGHEAIVKLLLGKGAATESKDTYGQTPLSYAARNHDKAIVQLLLDKGAATESQGGDGQTPLSWAAQNGHEVIVKLLLDKGAATESKDTYGQKPLNYAAQNGHEAIVKLLLDKGAAIESKGMNGWTPLSYAAQNGHEAIVKLLLDKGAATEPKSTYGQTPLSLAALNGHDVIVKLLQAK